MVRRMVRIKVTTCTGHCSQCDRHFHSLEAFDLHHERDDTGWPACLDPLDLEDRDGKPRLQALTTEGECRMYPPKVERGVTIWTLPRNLERASGRKPALSGSAEAA